jgi:hypothetical protein
MTSIPTPSHDPVMPHGWSPDRHTLETLAEVFPEVDVERELASFSARWAGHRLSQLPASWRTGVTSWLSAFLLLVRRVGLIEIEFAGRERELEAVEASTVHVRGHLRLLRTA